MIKKGTRVKWEWGNGTAEGKVENIYTTKTAKVIKGNKVTRNAEAGNRAVYIRQDDGDYVLKSENEIERLDK